MLSPTQRATLTEYMTQPVEDYSLLSFHDEEDLSLSSASHKQVTSRRWFVRRLTHEEASKYRVGPSCSSVKESNLFRLAVPLQPLIGWDLTPVIDLEVIPPETTAEDSTSSLGHNIEQSLRVPEEESRDDADSPKWRPLKGIRSRAAQTADPTVKIRSMSVSLLSTKEEVRQLMSKSPGNEKRDGKTIEAKDKDMQVEAIGMVGKVEEWLKPHITFEAELAWQDGTPLIGWDLTPVIDLEVIPPETTAEDSTSSLGHNIEQSLRVPEEESRDDADSPKWRPLKGIRSRAAQTADPTVKIRSMSVSLLSTKEEVRQLMSKSPGNEKRDGKTIEAKDKDMQVEAIGMVGKVEEWLKPHITFEAELAWQDGTATSKTSVVTVKSSAVTSLTIPTIPNDIIRATVPSAFLVKRLGATLTSKALEICLPRFLRQLERDYYRWSGIE